MEAKVVEWGENRDDSYTVIIVHKHQSFFLNYRGSKKECQWFADMFQLALDKHNEEQEYHSHWKKQAELWQKKFDDMVAIRDKMRDDNDYAWSELKKAKKAIYEQQDKAKYQGYRKGYADGREHGTQVIKEYLDKFPTPPLLFKKDLERTPEAGRKEETECPKCRHYWTRHIQRFGGYACAARDVDASGNFDGCGCGEVPPRTPESVRKEETER
jgi:hypothetical protein